MIFFRTYLNNLLAACLLIIFSFGISEAESEHPLYRYKKQDQEGSLISGRVLDGQTLKPVSQARVYLNNFPALSAMSDSNGYFQLETGPVNYPSQITLVCSGDDYYAREYPLNLIRDQEIISLGWIFLEKIEKTPDPEFSEILLFGMLVDDSNGSSIKNDQTVSIEDAPEINFQIDRTGVFSTYVSKSFFEERGGKFLMTTSADEYATTITDARLSSGLAYYDLGKIKLTYVGETAEPAEPATLENISEPAEPSLPSEPAEPAEVVTAPEVPETPAPPVVELPEENPVIPVPQEPEEIAEPVPPTPEIIEVETPEVAEIPETPEIPEITEVPEVVSESRPTEEVVSEAETSSLDGDGDGRELKELQQAYFLIKTMESQGEYLDREGVDLLSMIFERYESPASAKHLATLAEEESLTIPCITEGMQIYRSEYFSRLSRMLSEYLGNYDLNQIRVDENQAFYRELLGTLTYLEDFYENNPEEPDKAAYENTVELYSNIISRYFKED